MKNRYFFLRHGQTNYHAQNKNRIYPSWPGGKEVHLTKQGKKQIEEIAKKLKKEKITAIYSSDAFRAKQTSRIAGKILDLKINFDKRLRDIKYGEHQGKPMEDFFRDFPDGSLFKKRPKGGENWNNIKKRLKGFIKIVEKRHKKESILVVSHKDPIWLAQGLLKGFSSKKMLQGRKKGNKGPKVGEFIKI